MRSLVTRYWLTYLHKTAAANNGIRSIVSGIHVRSNWFVPLAAADKLLPFSTLLARELLRNKKKENRLRRSA